MKKLLFLFVAAAMLCACSQDENFELPAAKKLKTGIDKNIVNVFVSLTWMGTVYTNPGVLMTVESEYPLNEYLEVDELWVHCDYNTANSKRFLITANSDAYDEMTEWNEDPIYDPSFVWGSTFYGSLLHDHAFDSAHEAGVLSFRFEEMYFNIYNANHVLVLSDLPAFGPGMEETPWGGDEWYGFSTANNEYRFYIEDSVLQR